MGQAVRIDLEPPPLARPNVLVQSLACSKSAAALEARLEYTRFQTGAVLETAKRPIAWIFFPDTALVSLTASGFGGRRIGVGLVGYGGITGVSAILGTKCSYCAATVDVGGTGWILAPADFVHLAEEFPDIRAAFLQLALQQLQDGSLAAVALGHLTMISRLAWWLLEARRASGRRTLVITHERLATLLGVRRSGITESLHELQSTGSISASRMSILIVDDKKLRRFVPGLDITTEEEPWLAEVPETTLDPTL
jgi:CRP-like cAMP-binding protein